VDQSITFFRGDMTEQNLVMLTSTVKCMLTCIAGTKVLLCSFHVEQAWQRWLGSKKNRVIDKKDAILKQ
jgi:hypothetical protein